MHKYSMFDFPDNIVIICDGRHHEDLRATAFNLIHDCKLDPEQKKSECSRLLFKLIERGSDIGYPGILELLLENGADPEMTHGVSILYLAVTNKNIDAVRLLLSYNANPDTKNSFLQQTPLMQAMSNENLEIAELLLAHGADPNIADINGVTALMKALKFPCTLALAIQRKAIIYKLLSRGANSKAEAHDGMTAIDLAKKYGLNTLADNMSSYPDTSSLKKLCLNYIKQNVRNFLPHLQALPEELRSELELSS